jgi:hypothetical protein
MIFIILVFIAIGLYILGYKITALVIFFFFITSGFNLIPEEVMESRFFTKGMDYAILITCGIVFIDSFCVKNYFKPDKLIWLVLIFYMFLSLCVIYNRHVIGTSWNEVIRTARYNFLWIAYLIFRNMTKEQLHSLLKCLFWVTVFCSVLYLFQIVLNENILNQAMKSHATLFGIKFPRFYNQPDMLQIFTFMAIYANPYKGKLKIITTIILITSLLSAFHRSLVIAFILAISIGYVIRLPRIKRIIALSTISIFSLFFIVFLGYKFLNSRTIIDVGNVLSGNVSGSDMDIDIENMQNSTFTFRIAHFLERNQYILENPKAMLFGAGLMTEDSKLTDSMFNFAIGLAEEASGKTTQLDTGDISYSILFLRYGYLGSFLNITLYVFLMIYFYRSRDSQIGLFSFVYFIVVIIGTFFSQILTLPISFLLPLITYTLVQKNKPEYE